MIKRLFFIIFLALIVIPETTLARGASDQGDQESAHKKHKKKKKAHKKDKMEKEDAEEAESKDNGPKTSKDLRGERPYSGNLNYTPLSDYMLKYGASFGYAYNNSLEFSLFFLTGAEDFKNKVGVTEDDYIKITKVNGSAMLISANGRYFFGNSFSLVGGLGYRTATMNMGMESKVSDLSIDAKINISNVILFIGLGNHWVLDSGLTLGCDWAAVSVPITKSSGYTMTSTGLTDAEIEDMGTMLSDVGTKISAINALSLAIVNIGYRF